MQKRTRSRGALTTVTATRQVLLPSEAPSTSSYPNGAGDLRVMTDYVSSGFRKLQAEGGVVNTPMQWTRDIRSGGDSTISGTYTDPSTGAVTGRAIYTGNNFHKYWGEAPYRMEAVHIDSLRVSASTSALAGVEAPAVQGQVFLVELKKTLGMIRRPMDGLVQYLKAYQKRRRNPRYKGGASLAATAAGSWLEYRFGWRPFLLEMEAGLDTLLNGNFVPRKTSRAMRERTVTSTVQRVNHPSVLFGGFSADLTDQFSTTYTVRAGVLYATNMDLSSQLGFRWADLPSTAWELVPFSFVVDWFANVGDLIQALVPKGGVTHLAEFETIHVKSECRRTCSRISGATGWVYTPPEGTHVRIYETFERVPKLTSPGFSFAFSLEEALKGSRVLDAVALLTQIFRRK